MDKQVDSKSSYYYYSWNKKKIYFKQTHTYHQWMPIPTKVSKYDIGADVKTFEVIDEIIAKDKYHVYCLGAKVEQADASSFYKAKRHLYKDKNHVFINYFSSSLDLLEGADPETYEYINDNFSMGLAKDKHGYFYSNKRIDVDTNTFQVLSELAYGGFDENYVYDFGKHNLKNAIHGKILKVNDKLLYDDDQIFHFTWQGKYCLNLIPMKDKKTFVVYSLDKNTVFKANDTLYWNNYEINNLDLQSFRYIGGSYAKDKNGVYFVRNIQNNNVIKLPSVVDLNTFKYKNDNIAYDKANVYYNGQIIPSADYETIEKTEHGLKDQNNAWKWNKGEKRWDLV